MIYKIFMGKSLSFLMFCNENVLTDNVVGKSYFFLVFTLSKLSSSMVFYVSL